MEFSNSNIKKMLMFSQKKAFLIFPEMKPCTFKTGLERYKNPPGENFLCFRKQEPRKLFYIFLYLGKLFIFQETEAPKKLET